MMTGNGTEKEPQIGGDDPKALAEVLASIRALVSAETQARVSADDSPVLLLTPEMRTDRGAPARSGEVLAEGIEAGAVRIAGAPILDEEALRGVVNDIVREELQGELGDRISRNLRKLIRREIGQMLEERKGD